MRIELNHVCVVPSDLELPERLYKYREINQNLIKSLVFNEIWFGLLESFNDPFESSRIFSETDYGQLLKETTSKSGVLCLCKNNKNLPMWSYYGGGLRGISIGYDTKELLNTLEPSKKYENEISPRWRYVFDMKYDDIGVNQIDEMNLLNNDKLKDNESQKILATKGRAFEHEEEVRIVIDSEKIFNDKYGNHGEYENFEEEWVSTEGLYKHSLESIKEIVFGELCSTQDKLLIKQILADNKSVSYKVAVRCKNQFKIEIVDDINN